MIDDERFMKIALEIAKKGEGYTSPNPMVGAVVVKRGQVIGKGYHKRYGGKHAEVSALESACVSTNGATLYVTLEPCNHYGKTPPCVPYIVKKGIKRVVISMIDPNPIVSGRGVKALRDEGISVSVGVLEEEAKILNEYYIKYITTKLPFVVMKTAMTLDGKIAVSSKKKEYLIGKKGLLEVHKLRWKTDSILVGINTILNDNPQLTARVGKKIKFPYRIILDTNLRIPENAKVCEQAIDGKTIVVCSKSASAGKIKRLSALGCKIMKSKINKKGRIILKELMNQLAKINISSVLIEGGGEVNFSALQEGVVDKIYIFIAPLIVGGRTAPTLVAGEVFNSIKEAFRVKDLKIRKVGEDIILEGKYIKNSL